MNWTQTQIKNTDVWKRLFDRKSKRLSFAVLFLAFFVATYSRRKRRLQLCFNKLTTLPQTSIRDQLYLTNLKTIVSKSNFVWCSLLLFYSNMQSFANGELKFKIQKNETRTNNEIAFCNLETFLGLKEYNLVFFWFFFTNYKSSLTAILTLQIWPYKKRW